MTWASTMINTFILIGSCDPYGLNKEAKNKEVVKIVNFAEENKKDPYELLAIAITESSLNPKAFSHTRDSGLFQINCKWWYKKFKFKSRKSCERLILQPIRNISAGSFILNHYRNKYKQCKGKLAYRCYNGGPGWPRSKNKHKIIKYQRRVLERKFTLHKYYKEMIETMRSNYQRRS